MTILEFLDRIGERRTRRMTARPHRPWDVRAFIGMLFLAGYYWMVWQFSQRALPQENLDLIRDAMLTLGPPVGLIVGSMFRNDIRDQQMTENTGRAFEAVTAAAKAGSTGAADENVIRTGDEVEIKKSPLPEPAFGHPKPDPEIT